MTVQDVKQQIMAKEVSHYYVFTGDELEVMNIFIKKIADIANANICRADTLNSVCSRMQNKSFLSTNSCYVIRDDKEFMSAENMWAMLESGELQNDNIVIMLYTTLDKRSKFYKHINDRLIEFNALTDENLKREVHKRIALSDKNTQMLIEICDHNFGIILNEIDKIKNYKWEEDIVMRSYPATRYDMAFEDLLSDGVIHQPPQDCIWDFIDAVLCRQKSRAFMLLSEALEFGNPVLTLVSVLYKDTRQLLQVQNCQSQDISKTTGLSGWDIKRAMPRKNKYTNRELINAMRLIQQTEVGIKSGSIEESVALEYILVNML